MNKKLFFLCSLMHVSAYADEIATLHTYLWANYLQYNKEYAQAKERFEYLINQNPSAHVYKGYIVFLYQTHAFAPIVQYNALIDEHFAHDQEIQLMLAQALHATGNIHASDMRFIRLHEQYKNHADIAYQTAHIYMRKKEPAQALQVIDNYLNNSPRKPANFIFYFLQSKVHTLLNDKQSALASIKKSIELHPRFDKGWLVVAALEEEAGNLQAAITGYTTFLSLSTEKYYDIEQHVSHLVFRQKSGQNAVSDQHYYSNALKFFDSKEYTVALQNIDSYLQKKPQDINGRMLKIQILGALNQFDEASQQLADWMLEDPDNDLWYQTVHLLHQAGLSDAKTVHVFARVSKKYPHKVTPALYLADMYTRTGDYTQAVTWMNKARELTDNVALQTKLSFHLGLMHYEHNDIPAAIQALEKSSMHAEQCAPLANLLAYCYAQTESNLTAAQELIDKALALEHDNPHYLDTQAFIWYTQKEYAKAHDLLTHLATQLPNDVHITQHLVATSAKLSDAKGI